ncbi:hypothetical protein ACOSP7_029005 [Xanthoceras sorbifolium]
MGCRQSRYFGGLTNEDLPSSSKASLVMSFHSSARWQLHFDSCKESSQLMVVDFASSRSWRGKRIEPAVRDMATKFADVEFVKIDVDELSDVAKEFEVQATPTFVLVKRGKEVDRVVGAKKDELQKKIQKHRAS